MGGLGTLAKGARYLTGNHVTYLKVFLKEPLLNQPKFLW